MLMHRAIQSLKQFQEANGKQAKTIKELRNENDLLRAKIETLSASNSDSRKPTPREKKIQALGKKFCMVQCAWLEADIFELPNTFEGDPESRSRFSTKTSDQEGTRAVLQLMIPEHLQGDMINSPDFPRHVCSF